jgi:hypothetical protein
MPITPNRLYPAQMNGPVISANGMAVDAGFEEAEAIEKYLYELSIDKADETELENIGLIIGYPRPLVPEGFNSENVLLLGPLPLESDPDIGLASVEHMVGGELSSIITSETNYMSLGNYRKFLKAVAIIKRYGITLDAIDRIAATVSDDYEITWQANADILITFNEDIGYKNIWLLTQLFYRVATEPQVLIQSTEGEST